MSRHSDESNKKESPFEKELSERSIEQAIKDKCNDIGVTSIAGLQKMKHAALKKAFKTDSKASHIDWRHLEALWSGDTDFPKDYVPPIRKQIAEHGINQKYADLFEEQEIHDLNDVSEAMLGKVVEVPKNEGEDSDVVETDILDIRNAMLKVSTSRRSDVSDTNPSNPVALEDDPKVQVLLANQNLVDAQLKKLFAMAKEMETEVETNLTNMKPEETAAATGTELSTRINETKKMIEKAKFERVGKHFKGLQLMDTLNKEALSATNLSYGESYKDNEDLVAAASGGQALCGMYFSNAYLTSSIGLRMCKMHALATPDRVYSLGVTTPFKSDVVRTTSEDDSNSYKANAMQFGMETAEYMHSNTSAAAMAITPFGGGAVSGSVGSEKTVSGATQEDSKRSKETKRKSTSAQLTEYVMVPMRTFQIPRNEMKLSSDAIIELRDVTDEKSASRFLERFGTHLHAGRRTYGGVFFRTISLMSESELDTIKMFAAAGTQIIKITKDANSEKAGGFAFGEVGMGGAVVTNSSRSSDSTKSGSCDVEEEDKEVAKKKCTYHYSVQCIGPNATTIDEFFNVLQKNNRTWACIDNGLFAHSLVPIWDIVKGERSEICQATTHGHGLNNSTLAILLEEVWMSSLAPSIKNRMLNEVSLGALVLEGQVMKHKKEEEEARAKAEEEARLKAEEVRLEEEEEARFKADNVTLGTRETSSINESYSDRGGRSNADLSVFRPLLLENEHRIMYIATQSRHKPKKILVVTSGMHKGKPALAAPKHFECKWTDSGTGGDKDGSLWKAIPPSSLYVALSDVAVHKSNSGLKPGVTKPAHEIDSEFMCVLKSLCNITELGKIIWTDAGSGGSYDGATWSIQGSPGMRVSRGKNDRPSNQQYKLKC